MFHSIYSHAQSNYSASMKYFIQFILFSLLFASCAPNTSNSEGDIAYPEDLEGKKQLLSDKRIDLQRISDEITKLEEEIAQLDPASQLKTKQLVTTAKVERADFQRFTEIQGAVAADDLVAAASESPGRILQLMVKEGDFVQKGKLIAKLDLEQVNKQIAELEKSLELATTVYERQARLWEQNIGSEIQYLEAKNSKERLEKSLETVQFQLTKSEVVAPISGVVDNVVLHAGEYASPGLPIVQILNTNKLKVVADIPETLLRSVGVGEQVNVEFPALDMTQQARITLVGRTIDQANRTFKAEAAIPKTSSLIKPNLLAFMHIKDFEVKDVVTIPLDIVQEDVSGKKFVFITAKGDKGTIAKKVYLTTGEVYKGNVIIEEGLKGGEELIIDGSRGLADSELIQIQNLKTEANNG